MQVAFISYLFQGDFAQLHLTCCEALVQVVLWPHKKDTQDIMASCSYKLSSSCMVLSSSSFQIWTLRPFSVKTTCILYVLDGCLLCSCQDWQQSHGVHCLRRRSCLWTGEQILATSPAFLHVCCCGVTRGYFIVNCTGLLIGTRCLLQRCEAI